MWNPYTIADKNAHTVDVKVVGLESGPQDLGQYIFINMTQSIANRVNAISCRHIIKIGAYRCPWKCRNVDICGKNYKVVGVSMAMVSQTAPHDMV